MKFYDLHQSISQSIDSSKNVIELADGIDIHYITFHSKLNTKSPDSISLDKFRKTVAGGKTDASIAQNKDFRYPVFTPKGRKNNKAILLLHGLNERKWDKYYTWAHRLVQDTGKSVILFPFSFHQDRGLPDWVNRNALVEKAEQRKQAFTEEENLITFLNSTLSDRLTEAPERFFLSGLQTANDIVSVLTAMRDGKHPLFEKGTQTDIFAYSIGGLLGQVLYMSNPENLFEKSKLFLFCGGSVFEDMNGISKVIMDAPAYKTIYSYYMTKFEEDIKKSNVFAEFFNTSRIGMAFRSMISHKQYKAVREKIFKSKARMIYALALKNDKVIPPGKIKETIFGRRKANMEVLDFDYPYSHEMPFPMKLDKLKDKIDAAFESVFFKAGVFLR
ncbi:MAG: DUF6051 family protein [Bacteroidales bacterium]|nr:DUF6051 family protein [Bacteroidales bacterium]MCF8389980.1 DUF6051 family protein [Bacteroidales bacterium]